MSNIPPRFLEEYDPGLYRQAQPEAVDPDVRAAGRGAYRAACRDLGVDAGAVRFVWIVPTLVSSAPKRVRTPRSAAGAAKRAGRRRTVYVRADQAPREAAHTAAHEVRHVWQWKEWSADNRPPEAEREADADEYADALVRERWPFSSPEDDLEQMLDDILGKL
jgi:hypothetical protein